MSLKPQHTYSLSVAQDQQPRVWGSSEAMAAITDSDKVSYLEVASPLLLRHFLAGLANPENADLKALWLTSALDEKLNILKKYRDADVMSRCDHKSDWWSVWRDGQSQSRNRSRSPRNPRR